jgi:hypothetical protein
VASAVKTIAISRRQYLTFSCGQCDYTRWSESLCYRKSSADRSTWMVSRMSEWCAAITIDAPVRISLWNVQELTLLVSMCVCHHIGLALPLPYDAATIIYTKMQSFFKRSLSFQRHHQSPCLAVDWFFPQLFQIMFRCIRYHIPLSELHVPRNRWVMTNDSVNLHNKNISTWNKYLVSLWHGGWDIWQTLGSVLMSILLW